ncbi:hypothetical protein LTR86_005377 [Recurvomyces mirabilis]|nr:hypothetical protein LTR86_005377 [Recurvomyces mirabilis]
MSIQGAKDALMQGAQHVTGSGNKPTTNESHLGRDGSGTGDMSSGPIPGAGRQEGGSVAPIPGGHATSGLMSDGSEISTGATQTAPGSQYWQETEEVGIFETKDGRKTYAPDGHLTRTGAPPQYGDAEGNTAGASGLTGGHGQEGGEGLDMRSSRGQDDNSRGAIATETTGSGASREQGDIDTSATQSNMGVPTSGDPGATDAAQRSEAGIGTGNKASNSNRSAHLENPDAIPFAGNKKVGEDHYGESKMQPKAV